MCVTRTNGNTNLECYSCFHQTETVHMRIDYSQRRLVYRPIHITQSI